MRIKSKNLLLLADWFFPISVSDLMIGSRLTLSFFLSCWCWCRCRRSNASTTLSRASTGSVPALTIFSHTNSATCSRLVASISSISVPFSNKLLSSNRECRLRVATCGLDQRLPPSSTSSSNLTQRAVSFHSTSSPSLTNSSISENNGWDSWFGSVVSSPNINCTRCAGGVTGWWWWWFSVGN